MHEPSCHEAGIGDHACHMSLVPDHEFGDENTDDGALAACGDAQPVGSPKVDMTENQIGAAFEEFDGVGLQGLERDAASQTRIGFEINPLHNLVHLAIGLAGLALWRRLDTARTYGWLLAAGYGLAFIYGLFAAGNSDINFLSLNGADNVLHLVSAVAGVAIALWPAQRTARRGGLADRGA